MKTNQKSEIRNQKSAIVILAALCLLTSALRASATWVFYSADEFTGEPNTNEVTFTPYPDANYITVLGTNFVVGLPKVFRPGSDGTFATNLQPNSYRLTIRGIQKGWTVAVTNAPDASNAATAINLTQFPTSVGVYTHTQNLNFNAYSQIGDTIPGALDTEIAVLGSLSKIIIDSGGNKTLVLSNAPVNITNGLPGSVTVLTMGGTNRFQGFATNAAHFGLLLRTAGSNAVAGDTIMVGPGHANITGETVPLGKNRVDWFINGTTISNAAANPIWGDLNSASQYTVDGTGIFIHNDDNDHAVGILNAASRIVIKGRSIRSIHASGGGGFYQEGGTNFVQMDEGIFSTGYDAAFAYGGILNIRTPILSGGDNGFESDGANSTIEVPDIRGVNAGVNMLNGNARFINSWITNSAAPAIRHVAGTIVLDNCRLSSGDFFSVTNIGSTNYLYIVGPLTYEKPLGVNTVLTNFGVQSFKGEGGGLTNLNASAVASGILPTFAIPNFASLASNNQSSVNFTGTFNGTFAGHALGTTNSTTNLLGTIALARLFPNPVALNTNLVTTNATLRGTNIIHGSLYFERFANVALVAGDNASADPGTNAFVDFILSGNTELSGIAGGSAGRILKARFNGGSITLKNQSGFESVAANRIITGTGGNLTFTNTPTIVDFIWSPADSRWVVSGHSTLAAFTIPPSASYSGSFTGSGTALTNVPPGSVTVLTPYGTNRAQYFADSTASRGVAISNAQQIAQDADTILVSGSAHITHPIGKNLVDWEFIGGTILASNSVAIRLNQVNCRIHAPTTEFISVTDFGLEGNGICTNYVTAKAVRSLTSNTKAAIHVSSTNTLWLKGDFESLDYDGLWLEDFSTMHVQSERGEAFDNLIELGNTSPRIYGYIGTALSTNGIQVDTSTSHYELQFGTYQALNLDDAEDGWILHGGDSSSYVFAKSWQGIQYAGNISAIKAGTSAGRLDGTRVQGNFSVSGTLTNLHTVILSNTTPVLPAVRQMTLWNSNGFNLWLLKNTAGTITTNLLN
jgi:hypothetical protein